METAGSTNTWTTTASELIGLTAWGVDGGGCEGETEMAVLGLGLEFDRSMGIGSSWWPGRARDRREGWAALM